MYDTRYDIAKQYAKRGIHVFPCHSIEDGECTCGMTDCGSVGKHPLTENGVKDATVNEERLTEFFTGEYAKANIAIATGKVSSIWVVDVDVSDSLDALTLKHGPFPVTPTATTGKGTHFYFRLPPDVTIPNSQSKIAPGIDVRGEGGYVIAPPSVHASGTVYTWTISPDDVPFADAPEWLVTLATAERKAFTLTSSSVDDRITKYLERCPPAVVKQRGHDMAFATVCKIFETFPEVWNRPDDDVLSLLEPWNARCEPPWTDKELRHKVNEARVRVTGTTQSQEPPEATENGSETAVRCPLPVLDVVQETQTYAETASDAQASDDEWPELNPDAFHGFAGDFVSRLEPECEADPVALLVTLLNAFGAIVGRTPHYPAAGVHHHVNGNVCVVGQSSRARKGTSLGYVNSLVRGVDEAFDERSVNGLSSGEGVIAAVSGGDTPAGTLSIPDRRLWIVETEFGQTLRVLKRDGNTLSPVLRNAWDGGTLSIMTKNSPMRAENAHISVLAHITVDELRQHLKDSEAVNGFGNRFLWILSKRSKLLPNAGTVDVSDLRTRLTSITQTARSIQQMKRSPEADRLWESVYAELVSEKRGTWDSVTSRAEAQTLRLSMLYALLDGTDTIDVPHLRAALAVWRYADDSARLIFGQDEGETLEQKILDVLRSAGRTLTKTEIRDRLSSSSAVRKALPQSLTWLASRNAIVITKRGNAEWYSLQQTTDKRTTDTVTTQTAPSSSPEDCPLPVVRPASPDERANGQTGNGQTDTATLGELLDFTNANGTVWRRKTDGLIWVVNEDGLTPPLKRAIRSNQDALSHLVERFDVDWSDDDKAFVDGLRDVLETGKVSRPLTEGEFMSNRRPPTHTIDADGNVIPLDPST